MLQTDSLSYIGYLSQVLGINYLEQQGDASDRLSSHLVLHEYLVVGEFHTEEERTLLKNLLKAIGWSEETPVISDRASAQARMLLNFTAGENARGLQLQANTSQCEVSLVSAQQMLANPELKKAAWSLLQQLIKFEAAGTRSN